MNMLRATLGFILLLACAACAPTDSQTAATPGCRPVNLQNDQDCQPQTGNQLSVHIGGTVSYGMMSTVR